MATSIRNKIADSIRDTWVNAVVPSAIVPRHWRWALLRVAGLHAERFSVIAENVNIFGNDIRIGTYSFVGVNVILDCSGPVRIGSGCSLGLGVSIVTGTHEVGPEHRRAGRNISLPVILEDGCWLGANVTVLPGVTIGRGCIVGANSLVTKDCEPNGLYIGQPARRVRELTDADANLAS
jgi:maltose O-acetyltransferase